MAKEIAAFRHRHPPMELPTAISPLSPFVSTARGVGSLKTREATYHGSPYRERDQPVADYNESYLKWYSEVTHQVAEHEPEITDPRFRSPLAANYLDHLMRSSKDKIHSLELQSRVKELGWTSAIHSKFRKLQLEPRNARPPVFPSTEGTGNAETVRDECFKRLLQMARAELGGPEPTSITSLAMDDAIEAYQPIPKKDDTPALYLKRAMLRLDRPQALHDAGLAHLHKPEGQSAYMVKLMHHLEKWVQPRDRTLLFAHLGALEEFHGRAPPTVANGGYASYFQSIEDTESIRYTVMHIKTALAGQAQESALNLPLNVLEARLQDREQAAERQAQNNLTETTTPTRETTTLATALPAAASVNELVRYYRDQSAVLTNLQRDVQAMTGQLKLQSEVNTEARRRQIAQGQHAMSQASPRTYSARPSTGGPPRQMKSPESFPPNLFSEMPAWVVAGMNKAGHKALDTEDPGSSYMAKGGPCAACGNAHGTAWCPHIYIVGSRFKSSRPADEVAAFQTRRATYITFPSSLQASLEAEPAEDTLRGDELMDDYLEDEDRTEAYMILSEDQAS